MVAVSVKVSKRNQITLPPLARKRLRIRSGDRLLVDVQDGMVILLPLSQNYTQALSGLHREIWKDSDDYIRGERDTWGDAGGR